MYRAFYYIIRKPTDIPAESAAPMNLTDVYSELFPLLKEEGEFLGIVDETNTTLQMMYQEETDTYWTEVPCPAKQGAYAKILTFDEAADLLKGIEGSIPQHGYEGFTFSSWV